MKYAKEQQILPFEFREAKNREDFVVGASNREAVKWIDRYPRWKNNGLIIIGPTASGKSHLASVWQKKSFCDIFNYEDVNRENKDLFNFNNITIEDIHNITNFKFFLHIFNIKQERNLKFLFTSRLNLQKINIKLEDIKSRLKTLPQALILLPTDEEIKGILLKLFKDKGVFLNEDIINFILIRIERTYITIQKLVNEVNNLSLKQKKNITIPLIKEVIDKK